LCKREKTGTWENFLNQIDPESDPGRDTWAESVRWTPEQRNDFGKLRQRLASLTLESSAGAAPVKLPVPESLEAYVKWAPEVGRFSFQWHISDGDSDFPARRAKRSEHASR
jgi:hypothetical protein